MPTHSGPDGPPPAPGAEPGDAPQRLLRAAVEAFAERGFHATTTRNIAARAGMSPAALYIHYRTKEELLFHISKLGHEWSVRLLTDAAEGGGSAADRLSAAIAAFVRWHAERHTTARVVQYELAALAEEHLAEIRRLRRRSSEILRGILAGGVAAGEFRVDDVRTTARAMLSLCVDVARWFDPAGPQTPAGLAARYSELALRMAGAGHAAGSSRPGAG